MGNLLQREPQSPDGFYRAVIEVPAGTNKKFEINPQNGEFEISRRNGQARVIDFLGYPLNYGFIPGTRMDKNRGGDGDPLDALIICESLPIKTVLEFIPIALLRLKDKGELDSKIIGIPKDPEMRTVNATRFHAFKNDYPAIPEILVLWFLNYDKAHEPTEFIAWGDEEEARLEIERWRI